MASLDRAVLAKQCADKLTDQYDVKDLMRFFHEVQYDFFNSLSPDELLQEAEGLGLANQEQDIVI